MKKINITEKMINVRTAQKEQEKKTLSTMALPEWMQTPFDEYFEEKNKQESITNSNVVTVNFSTQNIQIPKALAAANTMASHNNWYDQGTIAFKDSSGAILNIIFNKSSDSDAIEITVTVSAGEYSLLQQYSSMMNINCALFDNNTKLASLTAAVNHNGTFMHAEGSVISDKEPSDGHDFISLRFL